MPKTAAQLYRELETAQADHGPIAQRYQRCEATFRQYRRRGGPKAAVAWEEFKEADAAMAQSIMRCEDLYEQIACAEAYEADRNQDIARAEREAAEPRFAF